MRITIVSIIVLTFLAAAAPVAAGNCVAQDDLLSRVSQLQETARKASGGALGCGEGGVITLVTSGGGEIKAAVNLDVLHVFKGRTRVSDLLGLLAARIESNSSGRQNPMSGDVGDLIYVTLSALESAGDPRVVSAAGRLLEDRHDKVVILAFFTLLKMAKSGEELRNEVSKIAIPKTAREILKANGIETAQWTKMKENSFQTTEKNSRD